MFFNKQYAASKQLFLTFKGLLKVMYSSRVGCAENYHSWCISILFRATFGTEEERIDVSTDIMYIHAQNLRAVLYEGRRAHETKG